MNNIDQTYVVEAIVDHGIDENGVLRYKVKWMYEDEDSPVKFTWERLPNLTSCERLLNQYHQSEQYLHREQEIVAGTNSPIIVRRRDILSEEERDGHENEKNEDNDEDQNEDEEEEEDRNNADNENMNEEGEEARNEISTFAFHDHENDIGGESSDDS